MAWEDTYLLSPILLVLLVSGCCTEDTELLQAVEGQIFLVNCRYNRSQQVNMMKVWCQKTSTESCKVLASSLSTKAQQSKIFIQDHPDSYYFTVTMTTRTVRDSGLYYCGIHDNRGTIAVLKTIRLVVTRDSSDMSTSDIITTIRPTKVAILVTTKYLRRDWTMTQSTAVVSSPDPGVTFSNVTNIPRVSISSIMVPMVCGVLSKTLVFNVLFAVTWRSFGGQTMKPHNNGL
ncbi:triggering receptor expressed on myeloid cells 1-like [Alexandromys fortis]|uniref:triggering receptor expressed on myeloid cells 1-like n=1 Tax=Alexandromys fortis TaxID=100897 RepID=UPI0021539C39|nr:triggering receptor expressed on myeloid cells 1-like [Microtus fortis]